jgi:hypothetical protein
VAKAKKADGGAEGAQEQYDLADLAARSEQCERLRERREALKAEIGELEGKLRNARRKYQEAGWDYNSALVRFHAAAVKLRIAHGMLSAAEVAARKDGGE